MSSNSVVNPITGMPTSVTIDTTMLSAPPVQTSGQRNDNYEQNNEDSHLRKRRNTRTCLTLFVIISFIFIAIVLVVTSLSDIKSEHMYIILITLVFILPLLSLYVIFCCTVGKSKRKKTLHRTQEGTGVPVYSPEGPNLPGGADNDGFCPEEWINTISHAHACRSLHLQLQRIRQNRGGTCSSRSSSLSMSTPPSYNDVTEHLPPKYDEVVPPPAYDATDPQPNPQLPSIDTLAIQWL